MKKKLLLISLCCSQLLWSQETPNEWESGGTSRINFSQLNLTNWSAGGQNSINANSLISLHANRKREKSLWENFLEIGYGINLQGESESWIKTDDKIDFTSKYGYVASKKWSYAALFNFKTQFSDGYNYPNDSIKISGLFAPAYILESIGFDYQTESGFSCYISPATIKITVVGNQDLSNSGAFGVQPAKLDDLGNIEIEGENTRTEFGGYIRAYYKKEIVKNINVNSKVELFANYLESPLYVDVNWELLLAFKVNKFISASLSTQLIYDHDILIDKDNNGDGITDVSEAATQFKEVFGIGLAYTF
ncbi:MAG: DUF3078 domain-containing protein [Flavobacteriales bacterium]|tara:strand:- start:347 stop:1264 length:918 start_codon:yes stop_codon:yes gene_type:complete